MAWLTSPSSWMKLTPRNEELCDTQCTSILLSTQPFILLSIPLSYSHAPIWLHKKLRSLGMKLPYPSINVSLPSSRTNITTLIYSLSIVSIHWRTYLQIETFVSKLVVLCSKTIIQTKRTMEDRKEGRREGEGRRGYILTESNYVATNWKLCVEWGSTPTLVDTSVFIVSYRIEVQ